MQWTQTNRLTYRNPRYEVLYNDGVNAMVRVVVEFGSSASGPWTEYETKVEARKLNATWQLIGPFWYFEETAQIGTATAEAAATRRVASSIRVEFSEPFIRPNNSWTSSENAYWIVVPVKLTNTDSVRHCVQLQTTVVFTTEGPNYGRPLERIAEANSDRHPSTARSDPADWCLPVPAGSAVDFELLCDYVQGYIFGAEAGDKFTFRTPELTSIEIVPEERVQARETRVAAASRSTATHQAKVTSPEAVAVADAIRGSYDIVWEAVESECQGNTGPDLGQTFTGIALEYLPRGWTALKTHGILSRVHKAVDVEVVDLEFTNDTARVTVDLRERVTTLEDCKVVQKGEGGAQCVFILQKVQDRWLVADIENHDYRDPYGCVGSWW